MKAKNQQAENAVNLQELLNPKPKVSTPATFGHVLWMRRWLLLAAWLVLGIPSATFLAFFDIPKKYWVSANLRFPNVQGSEQNMARDVSIMGLESIKSLFKSYNVVSRTVQSLNLQFQMRTPNVFRRDVFASIRYDQDAPVGIYRFRLHSPGSLEVSYKPFGQDEWRNAFRGTIPASGVVAFQGFSFAFNQAFANGGETEFEAVMLPMGAVFEEIRKRLGVTSLDAEYEAKVNYNIFFEDRDPFLVADILNSLVRSFIGVFTGTTEVQDISVLTEMEKKLELGKQKEKTIQDSLANFYASHPRLLNPQQGDSYAMVNAQTEKDRLTERSENIGRLWNRRLAAGDDGRKLLWIRDAVNLLNSLSVVEAISLQDRMREQETRRADLLTQFPSGHPRVQALEKEMAALYPEVEKLVETTQADLNRRLQRVETQIARSLNGVPAEIALEARRLEAEKTNAARVVENLQISYDRAKLQTGREFFKVTVVDSARAPEYRPPGIKRRLAFSAGMFVFSAFPGIGLVLMLQLFFARIWNRDDVQRKLKLPVLGSVFYVESKAGKEAKGKRNDVEDRLIHSGKSSSLLLIENYRSLRAEIENFYDARPDTGNLAVIITSSQPFEGKSLVSANLAISFARKNKRTLLVDADFRHGRQEKIFQKEGRLGLTDILSEPGLTDEARKTLLYGTIEATHEKGLFLLARGRNLEGSEAITETKIQAILDLLQSDFEVVIVDTPPIIAAADAFNLMGVIRNVIFVTRSGGPTASEAEEAVEMLKSRDVKVACIVNAVRKSPFLKNRFTKYSHYYGT